MATDKKISELNSSTGLTGIFLAGIQSGNNITVAVSDLLNRSNHTGTQTADTISDFTSAVQAIVGTGSFFDKLTDTTDDITEGTTNKFTTSADIAKLAGIASGATANSSDAFLLDRANHTGTQLAATISDFSTAADARVSAAIGVTVQAYNANLTAWASVNPSSYSDTATIAANYQPLSANLTAWSGVNPSSYSDTATIAANYQPLDSDLTSWAGVTRAAGVDTFLTTPSSANLRALLTDEVGTGAAYFVGGALGTPASATLTNATGLPISTGVSGLGTGIATFLATPSSANLAAALTDETGTGSAYFVGGALGTPSSGTATNLTGLPISTGVSGLGTGVATFLATPSSANLRAALTDEVGTGAAYFVGGALGTPASGTATNLTGLPLTTGVTGTLPVANGGTGRASHTAYAVICGSTTGTGAEQSVASVGSSGQVLTSNGAGALPTFQAPAAAGYTLLGTITTTSGASQSLSGLTLTNYKFLKCSINGVSMSSVIGMTLNGSTVGSLSNAAGTIYGNVDIDLSTGAASWSTGGNQANSIGSGGNSGVTTASTSITFSVASGNFDAGSIKVYAI